MGSGAVGSPVWLDRSRVQSRALTIHRREDSLELNKAMRAAAVFLEQIPTIMQLGECLARVGKLEADPDNDGYILTSLDDATITARIRIRDRELLDWWYTTQELKELHDLAVGDESLVVTSTSDVFIETIVKLLASQWDVAIDDDRGHLVPGAEFTGLEPVQYWDWISGAEEGPRVLIERIAERFGRSVNELLGICDAPPDVTTSREATSPALGRPVSS